MLYQKFTHWPARKVLIGNQIIQRKSTSTWWGARYHGNLMGVTLQGSWIPQNLSIWLIHFSNSKEIRFSVGLQKFGRFHNQSASVLWQTTEEENQEEEEAARGCEKWLLLLLLQGITWMLGTFGGIFIRTWWIFHSKRRTRRLYSVDNMVWLHTGLTSGKSPLKHRAHGWCFSVTSLTDPSPASCCQTLSTGSLPDDTWD